jgi:hypothetical protein
MVQTDQDQEWGVYPMHKAGSNTKRSSSGEITRAVGWRKDGVGRERETRLSEERRQDRHVNKILADAVVYDSLTCLEHSSPGHPLFN